MIQTDILKDAGISEEDIWQLAATWGAFYTARNQAVRQIPHIVCTGIYNAGKSTLLNALAGKEIFPTGDIPTTKKIAQAEFGGAVYIDTPGLNAMEEDDRETQAAYGTADFILFVASAQNGGISAVEAAWLKNLKEQYGSLQQRLIFVLTHCTQVEQEQLPAICDKICEDCKKAVGFVPEQLLCVDSITFQDGKSQNEPLLTESSGIPKLQEYLVKRIAGAENTLREAQVAELAARQRDVAMRIERCTDCCRQMIQKLSSQKQFSDIKRMFDNAEQTLINTTSGSATFYGGMSLVRGGESFEGKNGGDLKRSARDHVRNFVREVLDEAGDATEKMLERALADYGNVGLDSAYYKKCSEVNQVLEKLTAALAQQEIYLNAYQEIQIQPDVSRIASDLDRYKDNSSYWTANQYFDVFENRIEVNKYDYGYEERGLFGSVKWVPKYVIYTHNATYEIDKKISQTFQSNMDRAQQMVDRTYWQPFLKELRTEAVKRLNEMRKIAETSASAAGQAAEKPYRAALDHLNTLRKEVTQ